MKLWQPVLIASLALAACAQNDPATLVASAKQYIAKRDYNASIIQLKNALQKDPNNGEARYLLGFASLENGDVASADAELGKARELGYAAEERAVALARTRLAKGEFAKVVTEFGSTKLASSKLQAELRATVGAPMLSQNRIADAEQVFNEAIALDAGSATANLGLGRIAASRRDFGTAAKHVDQ